MNITPTQFKQLLLEEVGNCTEPQHVIFSIVEDMDPNDVAELFQDVFEQLPGVEMTRHVPEEPIPTSYQTGFQEQLLEMIRQELGEGVRGVGSSSSNYSYILDYLRDNREPLGVAPGEWGNDIRWSAITGSARGGAGRVDHGIYVTFQTEKQRASAIEVLKKKYPSGYKFTADRDELLRIRRTS